MGDHSTYIHAQKGTSAASTSAFPSLFSQALQLCVPNQAEEDRTRVCQGSPPFAPKIFLKKGS